TGFRVIVSTDNQIQKDFKYELPKSGMYVFKVNFYGKTKDGATYLLKDLGELKNEGSSGIVLGGGEHTVTLLYERAYQSLLDEIELMVKYEDVTSKADYLVLDLSSNEMRTSVTGPDIKDGLCRTDELWLKRIHSNINYHNCFYIGIFEITQKQFKTTSNKNPSAYLGDIRPVENVSYKTTSEFLEKLVEKTGNKFNLPTEEQWEYACTTDVQDMDEVGRYADDSDDGKGGYSEHTVVGSYSPNKWGLYDMLGNVCEWCKENNDIYVVRGGGWRDEARDCCYWSRIEVANDSYHNDRYGFRVVLPQY
ncbi:formylglycine-generating enzyme family protein, partial [bacterium]|nr:formylglycine-generating enzyme family protein [bacterium]